MPKSRERWSSEDWRACAETVGKMRQQQWTVVSHCTKCDLTLRADLGLIARIRGNDFSLWNKVGRCKRLMCDGVVEFKAHAPGVPGYFTLRAEWVEPTAYPPGQR